MKYNFDKKGVDKMMKDIQKDVEKSIPNGIEVDRSKSESQQIADVERQLKKAGMKPSRSEIRKMLRDL